MYEHTAILLDRQGFERWIAVTLGSAQLAAAQVGQFIALRCSLAESYDPLLRQPLFIVTTNPQAATCTLLVGDSDPTYAFLTSQPRGATLNVLGPLGHGWNVASSVRTLALLGTARQATALFALAHVAVNRGVAVSVLLGATNDDRVPEEPRNLAEVSPPPSFLLPAAAEYNVTYGADAGEAALTLLDDQLLRWADVLAVALPRAHLPQVAQRIRQVRLQWNRGFAQAAMLDAADTWLPCAIGVCGVCTIEGKLGQRLICSDGPIFDLRDLVR
jgi:dihydroorotate dehydrogenase electron transfer subunit